MDGLLQYAGLLRLLSEPGRTEFRRLSNENRYKELEMGLQVDRLKPVIYELEIIIRRWINVQYVLRTNWNRKL